MARRGAEEREDSEWVPSEIDSEGEKSGGVEVDVLLDSGWKG